MRQLYFDTLATVMSCSSTWSRVFYSTHTFEFYWQWRITLLVEWTYSRVLGVSFDQLMQGMLYLRNLKGYDQWGWKSISVLTNVTKLSLQLIFFTKPCGASLLVFDILKTILKVEFSKSFMMFIKRS